MRQETAIAQVARVLGTKPPALRGRLHYYKVKTRGLSPAQIVAALTEKTGEKIPAAKLAKLNGHANGNGNGLDHTGGTAQPPDTPPSDPTLARERRAILIALQRLERLARERVAANQYDELEVAALDAWLIAKKARKGQTLEI